MSGRGECFRGCRHRHAGGGCPGGGMELGRRRAGGWLPAAVGLHRPGIAGDEHGAHAVGSVAGRPRCYLRAGGPGGSGTRPCLQHHAGAKRHARGDTDADRRCRRRHHVGTDASGRRTGCHACRAFVRHGPGPHPERRRVGRGAFVAGHRRNRGRRPCPATDRRAVGCRAPSRRHATVVVLTWTYLYVPQSACYGSLPVDSGRLPPQSAERAAIVQRGAFAEGPR